MKRLIVLAVLAAGFTFSCSGRKNTTTTYLVPDRGPDYLRDRQMQNYNSKTNSQGATGTGMGGSAAGYGYRQEAVHSLE